jgi:hypothetical protein
MRVKLQLVICDDEPPELLFMETKWSSLVLNAVKQNWATNSGKQTVL